MSRADVVIIGGGIVGLAVAYRLIRRRPDWQVAVLEKENSLGRHQSGHNSGVLHSGIYYKPGSRRADNCRAGKQAMEEFCAAEGIPYDVCGKVIVATEESELPRLHAIYERGLANGVRCSLIEPPRLAELEPHAAGLRALHVPEAGIVDYRRVVERLAERLRESGGRVILGAKVTGLRYTPRTVIIHSTQGEWEAVRVVNCAGLHSDRMARLSGERLRARIVPFRGEYFALKPGAEHLCRNLIYPVPDPKFPFLGVHFTRMIGGGVECGPNAVLAFSREGYRKTDINLQDLLETLTYPGFLRLVRRHWRAGVDELWRSFCKAAFVRSLQRLVPAIRADHLQAAPAGVRAQAVAADGGMVDDFLVLQSERVVNVCNAPSPAATASLSIGEAIVDQLLSR